MKQYSIQMKLKAACGGLLAVLALIIAFQNTEVMRVQLLFWEVTLSKIVVLVVLFLLGAIAGVAGNFLLKKVRRS